MKRENELLTEENCKLRQLVKASQEEQTNLKLELIGEDDLGDSNDSIHIDLLNPQLELNDEG